MCSILNKKRHCETKCYIMFNNDTFHDREHVTSIFPLLKSNAGWFTSVCKLQHVLNYSLFTIVH